MYESKHKNADRIAGALVDYSYAIEESIQSV